MYFFLNEITFFFTYIYSSVILRKKKLGYHVEKVNIL